MKVRDLRPRPIVSLTLGDTLADAAKALTEEDIGALAVFDSHGVRGVLSERDLVRAIADDADFAESEIVEYMTRAPVLIDQEMSVDDAILQMYEHGVRHLIVTDDAEPSGMISVRDVLGALSLREPVASNPSPREAARP
jgi:CBS domain-containing protein